MKTVLVIGAAWAGLLGCGQPSPGGITPAVTAPDKTAMVLGQSPFFVPGEQIFFDISVRGITGAKASVKVGTVTEKNGRSVLPIVARLSTSGPARLVKVVQDSVTVDLDPQTATPVMLSGDYLFGKRRTYVEMKRQAESMRLRFRHDGKPWRSLAQRIPDIDRTYDGHGVLWILRGWRPPKGAKGKLYAFAGKRLWSHIVTYEGVFEVSYQGQQILAHRYQGTSRKLNSAALPLKRQARKWNVWITNDESRVPFRIAMYTRLGQAKLEVSRYLRPARVLQIED